MVTRDFNAALISMLRNLEEVEDELAELYGELSELATDELSRISLQLISRDSAKHRDILKGIEETLLSGLKGSLNVEGVVSMNRELEGRLSRIRECAAMVRGGVAKDLANRLMELEDYESIALSMYEYVLSSYESSSRVLTSEEMSRMEVIKSIIRSIIDDERFHKELIGRLSNLTH
ncbi:hypothetical protein [Caldivirga maquilingensis]|uniref:Rubrerythrin diiron-binding domain-containing protein n=1 Tax=Caldivirga maquilingensis (strain ATCC 700844 / DSM 13496 / JCM 10307 / IC-167) TaxID=397948 RepID=A8MBR6_CALMQ|nr:hypothetical protein [Caldivirga maquilingensis]ABW01259.1 hypothetical protein Cmaq_0414 [Caldivirga maquilingensis IC-167]